MLSGKINHIETNYSSRYQRAERVAGAAIMTLIEKYGIEREELFISTKQGFMSHDSVDKIPAKLIKEELC